MRLCLVVPGFSASEDDWCVPCLHHVVRRLAEDHEVIVVALRHPPRRSPYRFFGARVRPLAAGSGTGLFRARMMARALAAISREHRRGPFDAIHGLWADEAGVVATTAGRRLGVRSVVSVMGGELVGLEDIGYGVQLGRTGRWMVRRSLRSATTVTVGSRVLEDLTRRARPTPRPVWAPLGVDPSLFAAHGDAAALRGDPCLLQVASLTPVKGQRLLLEAFGTVARALPGAHLHVIGDGSARDSIERAIRDLALTDRVTLHGAVSHHLLPPYYRSADLQVISSRFESQCMVALEAAACGTATVGTAVGILPELGMPTAGSGTAAELAAVVLGALARPQATGQLAAAARARILDQLTLERCVERLVDLYSTRSTARRGQVAAG